MKMKALRSFETSGSTCPTTERHKPEGFSSQQRAVSTSALKTALSSSDSISLNRVYQYPSNGRSFLSPSSRFSMHVTETLMYLTDCLFLKAQLSLQVGASSYISNKSTRCNNFSSLLLDVYL